MLQDGVGGGRRRILEPPGAQAVVEAAADDPAAAREHARDPRGVAYQLPHTLIGGATPHTDLVVPAGADDHLPEHV